MMIKKVRGNERREVQSYPIKLVAVQAWKIIGKGLMPDALEKDTQNNMEFGK